MKVLYEESDILYVNENPLRFNVLKYLNSKKGFAKTREITDDLKIKRGNYHHHMPGSKEKGLIEVNRINKRSVYAKITDKGSQVIEEIEKREKTKREKPVKENNEEQQKGSAN